MHSYPVTCFHTELRTIWGEKLSCVPEAEMQISYVISGSPRSLVGDRHRFGSQAPDLNLLLHHPLLQL